MQLISIKLRNFRNYKEECLEPGIGINLLMGDNTAGKTNLLEAIYFCLCGYSFRTTKEEDVIRVREEKAVLRAAVQKDELGNETAVEISASGKKLILNGKEVGRRAFPGYLAVLLFRPEDLQVTAGTPGERRRFFDNIFTRVLPGYYSSYRKYHRALNHRNAVLRRLQGLDRSTPELKTWTEAVAETGSALSAFRFKALSSMAPIVSSHYREITGSKLAVRYVCSGGMTDSELGAKERFLEKLLTVEKRELQSGQTLVGPHRDDFSFVVDGRDLRHQGSRGEQRTAVLATKLAEARLIEERKNERLICLLDDVFSELDNKRRRALAAALEGRQVFITTTEPLADLKGCTFWIKTGTIISGGFQ
ncbi:MAG: DNA replication/repair protein RecF [Bacillota bacterium]